MAYSAQTWSVGQILTAAQMTQISDNIKDHVHGDGTVGSAFTELTAGELNTIAELNFAAISGIIESNSNFVDACLVGPSVDGKAWAGAFSNGSVWTSLMLATVETSGANAEVNIWDLTAGTLASATPLATLTLTGATPTSIAASMGYVIVGTSDQGIHIVDPHGGSWAERTVGWPRTLNTGTTPALTNANVQFVCAGLAQQPPFDSRTGGPLPCFGVGYGAGAAAVSIIKHDGNVWDKNETITSGAPVFIADGFLFYTLEANSDNLYRTTSPIDSITADGFSRDSVTQNLSNAVQVDTSIDIYGGWWVGADADGLSFGLSPGSRLSLSGGLPNGEATTAYNTGLMPGSIKLAALANSATADRSGNSNTLTENGTVTEAAVETGAEAKKYSGFSASNYLSRAYDADFDFGTGSLSILLWFYSAAVDSDQALVHRRDTGHAGAEIKLRVTSSGTVNFQLSGSGTATPTSAGAYDDGKWHLLVGTFDGTTATLNIDGGSEGITDATAPGNLDNGTAVLRIGLSPNGNSPADDSAISLVRISASSLSSDQIKRIYEAERGMFATNAKCLLQGASNAVLDARIDPLTGKYIVTQTDSQDIFDGLAIETERTVATGGSTFEHGLLFGDAVAEINNANLFASTPATDQRQVNEMVRSLSADLPAGVDLSKAKAWLVYNQISNTILSSFNIESVTDVTTGRIWAYFAVPFKTTKYVGIGTADATQTTSTNNTNTQTGYQEFYTIVSSTGATQDAGRIGCVWYGELENE
jgi:hypothetical protein